MARTVQLVLSVADSVTDDQLRNAINANLLIGQVIEVGSGKSRYGVTTAKYGVEETKFLSSESAFVYGERLRKFAAYRECDMSVVEVFDSVTRTVRLIGKPVSD